MTVSTGDRLGTSTSTAEVIVMHAPTIEGALTCAGSPLTPGTTAGAAAASGDDVALGKRYEHVPSGLELLCIKPGAGPIEFDGVVLKIKSAKPLPSSD